MNTDGLSSVGFQMRVSSAVTDSWRPISQFDNYPLFGHKFHRTKAYKLFRMILPVFCLNFGGPGAFKPL